MFSLPVPIQQPEATVAITMANFMKQACTICLARTHAVCAFATVVYPRPVKWYCVKPLPNVNPSKPLVPAITAVK